MKIVNKFEQFATDTNDYDVLPIAKNNSSISRWEKKTKTSFSIKKSNIEKLDELVKIRGAKSRSMIIDDLIEKEFKEF